MFLSEITLGALRVGDCSECRGLLVLNPPLRRCWIALRAIGHRQPSPHARTTRSGRGSHPAPPRPLTLPARAPVPQRLIISDNPEDPDNPLVLDGEAIDAAAKDPVAIDKV